MTTQRALITSGEAWHDGCQMEHHRQQPPWETQLTDVQVTSFEESNAISAACSIPLSSIQADARHRGRLHVDAVCSNHSQEVPINGKVHNAKRILVQDSDALPAGNGKGAGRNSSKVGRHTRVRALRSRALLAAGCYAV